MTWYEDKSKDLMQYAQMAHPLIKRQNGCRNHDMIFQHGWHFKSYAMDGCEAKHTEQLSDGKNILLHENAITQLH